VSDIQLVIYSNEAYGSDGKRIRDIIVVCGERGGVAHLAYKGAGIDKTFCGRKPSVRLVSFFQFAGCLKCYNAAKKIGVTRITDNDGETMDLDKAIAKRNRFMS
jgi:hypothetical protein